MASNINFVTTRTRMVLVKATQDMVIHHTNRDEYIKKGMMFGFDVSKKTTSDEDNIMPLTGKDGLIIRRIGSEAFVDCKWEIFDLPNEDSVVSQLISDADEIMKTCDNASYIEAWNHFNEQTFPHIYHQKCGIKIIIDTLDTVDEYERTQYPLLLVESDGSQTTNEPFSTKHAQRVLVCEPISKTGGFSMNEDGTVRGSSVYQKPLKDVDKDWMAITHEEAYEILNENEKYVPKEQIENLQQKIQIIKERKTK